MTSPTRLARAAGVLYLCVALSGIAILYVRPHVTVPGDAAATADNIRADATLFRLGFAVDLLGITCFLLVAMAFYLLLGHVHNRLAAAMVTFVAVAVAIQSINLLGHIASLRLATDESYAAALGADRADALVRLFLDLHTTGFQVSQIFFGLWLLPLGYLAYRSGYFPRALGILLIAGGVSYLVELPAQFLFHGLGPVVSLLIVAPAAVAEPWMMGYLLIKGIRTPRPANPVPVPA